MSALRVVLVGEGGVGKSCLTLQFISEKFIEEYDPTMEDSYRKQLTVDDNEYLLDIFDTAGQEDFSAVRDQYMRTGDGFLCVYSVTIEPSFAAVRRFHEHICRVKDADDLPFIMIGNKCDLVESRVISTEKGQELAEQLGVSFLETSAKTRQNVDEMFVAIVRQIIQYKQNIPLTSDPVVVKPKKKTGCFLL